jgi:hypothetical protein
MKLLHSPIIRARLTLGWKSIKQPKGNQYVKGSCVISNLDHHVENNQVILLPDNINQKEYENKFTRTVSIDTLNNECGNEKTQDTPSNFDGNLHFHKGADSHNAKHLPECISGEPCEHLIPQIEYSTNDPLEYELVEMTFIKSRDQVVCTVKKVDTDLYEFSGLLDMFRNTCFFNFKYFKVLNLVILGFYQIFNYF